MALLGNLVQELRDLSALGLREEGYNAPFSSLISQRASSPFVSPSQVLPSQSRTLIPR